MQRRPSQRVLHRPATPLRLDRSGRWIRQARRVDDSTIIKLILSHHNRIRPRSHLPGVANTPPAKATRNRRRSTRYRSVYAIVPESFGARKESRQCSPGLVFSLVAMLEQRLRAEPTGSVLWAVHGATERFAEHADRTEANRQRNVQINMKVPRSNGSLIQRF